MKFRTISFTFALILFSACMALAQPHPILTVQKGLISADSVEIKELAQLLGARETIEFPSDPVCGSWVARLGDNDVPPTEAPSGYLLMSYRQRYVILVNGPDALRPLIERLKK